MKINLNQNELLNLNKEKKNSLERLLRKVANVWGFKIYSLNLQTNKKPVVIEIIIKKANGNDISIDDCALFNTPASEEIENTNFWIFIEKIFFICENQFKSK